MAPSVVELVTVQTSAACVSYRLEVADSDSLTAPRQIVWSNRAFADVPASHAACRARARAWALQEGHRIVERSESERRRRA